MIAMVFRVFDGVVLPAGKRRGLPPGRVWISPPFVSVGQLWATVGAVVPGFFPVGLNPSNCGRRFSAPLPCPVARRLTPTKAGAMFGRSC